jgi:hypothetical protein
MDSNTKQKIKGKTTRLVKRIYNRLEKWYMRICGYVPTTFNYYTNKYEYELKSEIDKLESEEKESFEIYGYDKENTERLWWWNKESKIIPPHKTNRTQKRTSLTRGECIDKPLFRRNTE